MLAFSPTGPAMPSLSAPVQVVKSSYFRPVHMQDEPQAKWYEQLLQTFSTALRLLWKSRQESDNWKQNLADVFAGEYDAEAVRTEMEELIDSAPAVMFTWVNSPSCKKATEAFEKAGAQVKYIRLDDPWEKGNPLRAELGKKVGRTSVPGIFIDGKYVGGYDGGVSEEAPGIMELAFRGTLIPKLEAAGAKK